MVSVLVRASRTRLPATALVLQGHVHWGWSSVFFGLVLAESSSRPFWSFFWLASRDMVAGGLYCMKARAGGCLFPKVQ